jgi:hypothetical protein
MLNTFPIHPVLPSAQAARPQSPRALSALSADAVGTLSCSGLVDGIPNIWKNKKCSKPPISVNKEWSCKVKRMIFHCHVRLQEDNPESASCRTEESFSGAKDINDPSFWKNSKSKT